MSEENQQQEHYVPIWGIFLLFLGIVFLLQSLDVLPWGLWGTLWRFWPVLMIIIGLGILLRHYNVWLVSTLILALLFACLGISVWQYQPLSPAGQTAKSYSEPLGTLEQAQIEIDFTAGSLTVSSLPPGSLNLFEVDSEVRGEDTGMKVDFRRQADQGMLHLSRERVTQTLRDEGENRWRVRFNGDLPLTVDIKSAVASMDLDLTELEVTELQMDVDIAGCAVKMPASAGTVHAYIKADLANLEVIIPEGVGAKLGIDVDLGAAGVDESRFQRKGDYYVSSDFAGTRNRLELELDCALGRVQVR